ncbi:unnamed protein product [Symbiodinium natans]|uniref:Uncharacterized protein n=1 Tax=Symbiodinium natans TaxID=878477 RepID=A0A812LBZ2_9DINO|nr:unnamed protein product [Symbiodinium natans]
MVHGLDALAQQVQQPVAPPMAPPFPTAPVAPPGAGPLPLPELSGVMGVTGVTSYPSDTSTQHVGHVGHVGPARSPGLDESRRLERRCEELSQELQQSEAARTEVARRLRGMEAELEQLREGRRRAELRAEDSSRQLEESEASWRQRHAALHRQLHRTEVALASRAGIEAH